MKKIIKAGSIDQTIDIFIQDSSSTTGAGLTGLVFNSAGLTCYYRKGATGASTALTLATQTVTGAHSDGGFVEIDATNMPGMYRLDLSDIIVDTAGSVSMQLKGATNMAQLPIELQIVSCDLNDTVRLGLTALPNVASGSAGAVITSGTGTAQLSVSSGLVTLAGVTHTGAVVPTVTTLTNLPAITANWLTAAGIAAGALNGKGDWNIGKTGYALSAAGIQAIWDALTSALTTVGSVGKLIVDNINATISSRSSHSAADVWASATRTLTAATNITSTGGTTVPQTGDSFARLGAPIGASISADIAGVQSDTNDIQTRIPAALVGGRMDSNLGAISTSATAADNLERSTLGIVTGTVGAASTTTSIVTSALSPAAAVIDQFKGRIVTFDSATTTANLRGQSTDITANTAAGVLTVTALTTAPVSGDTFTIT